MKILIENGAAAGAGDAAGVEESPE